MKTFVNRVGLVVAGTLVLGGTAFGQTLKVNVPFAFGVGTSHLPAGRYIVIQKVEDGMWLTNLRNETTGRSFFSHPNPRESERRGTPQLTFLCYSGNCSLREIRNERGASTYPAPRKHGHESPTASLISLPLTAQGD